MQHISQKRIAAIIALIGTTLGFVLPNSSWEFSFLKLIPLLVAVIAVVYLEIETSTLLHPPHENDKRFAKILVFFHLRYLRYTLRDHDYTSVARSSETAEAFALRRMMGENEYFFIDKRLKSHYLKFHKSFADFLDYLAAHSSPEKIEGIVGQSIMTAELYNTEIIPERFREEIKEANRLADLAWRDLDALVEIIRDVLPSVFDAEPESISLLPEDMRNRFRKLNDIES